MIISLDNKQSNNFLSLVFSYILEYIGIHICLSFLYRNIQIASRALSSLNLAYCYICRVLSGSLKDCEGKK